MAGIHLLAQQKNSKMPPRRIPGQDFYEGPRWGRGFAYWIPEIWSAMKNKLQNKKLVDIWFLSLGVLKFGISVKKGFRMMWSILFFDICSEKMVPKMIPKMFQK